MTLPAPDLPATLTAPARGLLATLDARAGVVDGQMTLWDLSGLRAGE